MADDQPTSEIPVGQRLVHVRGTGLSLSARLAAQFYRLTWRTPLHGMRLKGRYPLKLLAVPDDPLRGNTDAGTRMLNGAIERSGERVPLGDEAFTATGLSEAFVDHIQRFSWLRDLAAAAPRAQAAPIAEAMTRAWLEIHGTKVTEAAWRPDQWGWRILNWAAYAPLILSSGDLVYRSAVLNALARGARHLDRTADRSPPGLQRIAGWSGVVTAGLLIAGGDPRRGFGETGLARALSSGITPDGGIVCRSPAAQAQAVLLLSQLAKVYEARKLELPKPVREGLDRLVPPLLGVRLGDGGLSSWQGARPIDDRRVSAIVAASGVRTRPLRQPRDWGYQRMASGQTVVICDAAPPPLARPRGGGCASTLAFELSDGDARIVVNCGGANGGGAALSAGLASGLRTSAAHSTLILADSNSTAVLADGALGKGVTEVQLDREDNDTSCRLVARHDGYARRLGLDHRRTLILAEDGRELHGEDQLLPAKGRKRSATAAFAVRFHLAPGIEVSPTADGLGALLRIARGPLWQFRCRGGTLAFDDSLWVDSDGRLRPTRQLVVQGESPPGGASVSWLFRRAG